MVSGGEKAANIPLFVKHTAFCVVMQHLCFILKVMVIFNKSAIMHVLSNFKQSGPPPL